MPARKSNPGAVKPTSDYVLAYWMARRCLLALLDAVAAGSLKPAGFIMIAGHGRFELEPPP